MKELLKKAKLAIGPDDVDDYKISLVTFPVILEKKAPELCVILKHSSFKEKAKRYEKNDALAIETQNDFKKYAHQATLMICSAAISGSLLASFSAANFEQNIIISISIFLLGLVSGIGGSFAIFRLHQIKSERLLEQWMTFRAKAETERLGYFNALSRDIVKNHGSDVYLHQLFICAFKRYQLDVQLLYYNSRSKDHRDSLKNTSTIGALAAFVLAIGSGVLGMTGAFFPVILPFAALGTIGAAISAVASRREDINQDERNMERYSRIANILSKIAERHDDVCDVVSTGKNPEIIIEYVDAINDQLSLEHRQWTSDASEMSSALSVLEESISKLHKE